MTTAVTMDVDQDGIALLTIDVPGQSMNVITPEVQSDLAAHLDAIESDEAIKGVVVTSGKASGFMAGADLKAMAGTFEAAKAAGLDALYETVMSLSALLRRMETIGKPVATAINGLALGGGLEICLATHYRVCADHPKIQLGLPEVMVGLLPGAGGTQRLPRMMGAQNALQFITTGKSMKPQEALGLGVVNELAPVDEVVAKAKAWVLANPTHVEQPWDKKGFKVPGGGNWAHPGFFQTFVGGNAMVTKETQGNYNAPKAIMSCVYEGLQLPMDKALSVEVKYFCKLILDPQSGNMIRTLFVNKQAAEKGARRPQGVDKAPTQKVGMLGAGLMGAGIAMVSAQAGIEVVLLDQSQDSADKGKAYSADRLAKKVKRGSMTQDKADGILARIHPTTSYEDLAGCDLIIEAVFENKDIKADVTKATEAVVGADTIFGSNTSTLPITSLAKAWSKAENFIGIHFFSPVEKMPLVEIITGKSTGPGAIAKALDYVAQIKKTPIVVNDSHGFYTSRVFSTYVTESYRMVGEGISAPLIDNCGRQVGFPNGPLAIGDEVAIDLTQRVRDAAQANEGDAYEPSEFDTVTDTMVELGRLGRKTGKGFYVFPEDGSKKYLWPDIANHFPVAEQQPDPDTIKERILYRQLVECARCYEEGVLETPEDGDIGAIFGWAFPPFTGGPFSHMDTVGIDTIVAKLERLTQAYGARFSPPQLLRDMAAKGETFYGAAMAKAA
ncbi:MAG: 3-hydroxyacyl-CoA dehydrogenase NAD-binding domain-containing protein [Pseudomonadota bacterium]